MFNSKMDITDIVTQLAHYADSLLHNILVVKVIQVLVSAILVMIIVSLILAHLVEKYHILYLIVRQRL